MNFMMVIYALFHDCYVISVNPHVPHVPHVPHAPHVHCTYVQEARANNRSITSVSVDFYAKLIQ